MNRRLKDRIPPVLKALGRKAPLTVLLVTATVVISPEALARVEAGEAVIEMTKAAPSVVEKTYTKEELSLKMPANPVPDLDDRIASEISGLFSRLTSNQRDAGAWNAMKTQQPDLDTLRTQLSALKDEPATAPTDMTRIRAYLAVESQKAMSQRVKSGLTVLDKINAGLSLDLDFGKMLGGGDKPSQAPQRSGTVRYGLLLKEIKPDTSAPERAAITDTPELDFAGHADVQWTIGPLTEEESRKLFNFSETLPEDEKPSFWSRFKLPRLAFRTKASPENLDNLAKVNDKNMPGMRVDLSQADGYYTMTHRMKSTGERVSAEHQFNVPTGIGELAFGRRFDDKFQVVETSAYNILIDRRLPSVSIHKMHLQQRYKTTVGTTIQGHTIALGHQGKATGPGPMASGETKDEKFTLDYSKSF